jgi:cytoskeletal protein RodZ
MDVGAQLKSARERRGKSVRDVANATKISVATLEALEQNDFSRLPGGIFARAFVRACAREVGLDPEPIVAEFIARCPGASPEHALPAETDPGATPFQTFRWLAVVGLLALLGAAAAGAYVWMASGQATPDSAPINRGAR